MVHLITEARAQIQYSARSRRRAEAEDLRATETGSPAARAEERAEQGQTVLEERPRQAVKASRAVIRLARLEAEAEARQPSERTVSAHNAERAEMGGLRT